MSGSKNHSTSNGASDSSANKMAVMPVGKLLVNMSLPLMLSLVIQSL